MNHGSLIISSWKTCQMNLKWSEIIFNHLWVISWKFHGHMTSYGQDTEENYHDGSSNNVVVLASKTLWSEPKSSQSIINHLKTMLGWFPESFMVIWPHTAKIQRKTTMTDHPIISSIWPQKSCQVIQNGLKPSLIIGKHCWDDFLKVSSPYDLIQLRYRRKLSWRIIQ